MSRYRKLLYRPIEMIPVLIGISFISFVLLQLTPGDPADRKSTRLNSSHG